MYLVDTNVISESRKGKKANRGVQEFWALIDPESAYLAVQTVGEIRRGVENIRNRGDRVQAATLEQWLSLIVNEYADRILSFDEDSAQIWGRLISPHNVNTIDKQIAAIALIHDLIIVTRNTSDFEGAGVKMMNPFS